MLLQLLFKIVRSALCFFSLMFASCNKPRESISVRETVLREGQIVEATNNNGTVKIAYVDSVTRKYVWDGHERVVKLIPRQEPFQGKLGIYEPADAWLIPIRTRLVVEEAIRSFDSEEQIKTALIESRDYLDWVYTDEGLVVGFGRTSSRRQVNIDLWQFLLRGQKPSHLPGATPERILLRNTR